MEIDKLKCVVGAVSEGKPAVIRLSGHIDNDMANRFNDEFLWLQESVQPSKIIVSINSEGGSVIHGMSIYTTIQQCPIEVETVIEGIAASMASVIWAAGTRSYMRDYSILMIHNPFMPAKDVADPDTAQMVNAFRKQLEIIYRKRFGLSKDEVQKIMNGEDGCDGTYFDAKQAVDAGIIPADHVIKTSKQVRAQVKNQIEGLTELNDIQKMMDSIEAETPISELLEGLAPIPNQNQIENSNSINNMEKETFAFGTVCSQLGMNAESGVPEVTARITELKDKEIKLNDLEASFNEMKIKKEGLEAQLSNVNDELSSVKNQLKSYQDAEKAQHAKEINDFIEAAIKDGKISEDSKEKWVELAQGGNFETVKATLNSIPCREQISKEIAEDPSNVEAALDASTEAERELEAKVVEAVGKDFSFKTLED